MEQNKAIAALSTGKGNAALAIIRVSGKNTFEIVKKIIKQENRFDASIQNRISLYTLINSKTKKTIDEAMVIKYSSPKSYTGEDMVEIICHGGEFVVDEILTVLLQENVMMADKGEFTKRAYLNGKMELLKAESIDQIINSNSKMHHEIALNTYQGFGNKKVLEWKEILKAILVELEAKIEFPDEDDVKGLENKTIQRIEEIHANIKKETEIREKIKYLEKGISIPIVGISNAGKSTLFNMILGFDRSIVHKEAGTTRDAVSEEVIISGEKIKIFDTAGLNETQNQIEMIGIKKSWELISGSNIIIWVTPANMEITDFERNILNKTDKKKLLGIISKLDCSENGKKREFLNELNIPCIEVSLIEEKEKEKVYKFLKDSIEKEIQGNNAENAVICTLRQEEIYKRMLGKTENILEHGSKIGDEILAHKITELLKDIGELVGETTSEDILNAIFSSFCIGK